MASRPRERPGRRWCQRPWSSAPGHTRTCLGSSVREQGERRGPEARPRARDASRVGLSDTVRNAALAPRASQGSSEDETRRSAGETGVACTHSLTHSFIRWFVHSLRRWAPRSPGARPWGQVCRRPRRPPPAGSAGSPESSLPSPPQPPGRLPPASRPEREPRRVPWRPRCDSAATGDSGCRTRLRAARRPGTSRGAQPAGPGPDGR